MRYHADWVHDDIPVPIATRSGQKLVSVPYNYDINDGPALEGHFDAAYLVDGCIAQFDRLHAEAAEEGGKVFCLALHTYLMGQPHTIGALRRILDHVCRADGVWFATGGRDRATPRCLCSTPGCGSTRDERAVAARPARSSAPRLVGAADARGLCASRTAPPSPPAQ